jgi:NAD(P)-dependent dehydrogenase (short-subunit alcohol dehydrogenase family)
MPKFTISQLFDLQGRSAIVTGAAQGMGKAIAQRLAEAGAHVLIAGHNERGLKETAEGIKDAGGRAAWVSGDIAKLEDLDRIVRTALEATGGADILVNNAGGMHPFTPAEQITEEIWEATLGRNLKGTFFLSQKVAKWMIGAGKGGRIINIASIAALRPDPQLSVYNASKAGVVSLTKSLATEFAPHGILVNAVVPGPTMTPNTAAVYDVPDIQKILRERVPLGHVGTPEDVSNAVLFLASHAADHVTGSLVVVDGGMTVT